MIEPGAPLANRGLDWIRADGADAEVVLSSRVRLARNLQGFPFPGRAGLEDRAEILERVRYGLGVRPEDISTMEDVALSAYDTLWGRLGSWAQVRALYKKIEL